MVDYLNGFPIHANFVNLILNLEEKKLKTKKMQGRRQLIEMKKLNKKEKKLKKIRKITKYLQKNKKPMTGPNGKKFMMKSTHYLKFQNLCKMMLMKIANLKSEIP